MAYLPCDKCGKTTTHQGSWDTPIKILCDTCGGHVNHIQPNQLQVGDRVTYYPHPDTTVTSQQGRVKSLNELDPTTAFVVFHCNNNWDDYENYTGQSTKIANLKLGWRK